MSTRSRRSRALDASHRSIGWRSRQPASLARGSIRVLAVYRDCTRSGASAPAQARRPFESRAALKTFLDSGDAVAAYLARDYLPSPSRARFDRLVSLGEILTAMSGLERGATGGAPQDGPGGGGGVVRDPEQDPAAASRRDPRRRSGQAVRRHRADAMGDPEYRDRPGTRAERAAQRRVPVQRRYRCPGGRVLRAGARIALCPPGSPRERARDRRHRRGLDGPVRWIQALPASLRTPIAGQSGWKWIGMALSWSFSRCSCGSRTACRSWAATTTRSCGRWRSSRCRPRFLRRRRQSPTWRSSSSTCSAPWAARSNSQRPRSCFSPAPGLRGASHRWSPRRSSPRRHRAREHRCPSHPRRAACWGSSAGWRCSPWAPTGWGCRVWDHRRAGCRRLAIALAAQPTIENLIGGLSLFADKPIRVGDLCKYGDAPGQWRRSAFARPGSGAAIAR